MGGGRLTAPGGHPQNTHHAHTASLTPSLLPSGLRAAEGTAGPARQLLGAPRADGAPAAQWAASPEEAADKAPLAASQKVLDKHLATLKGLKGVKEVKRVVCGGCYDFKIITALAEPDFGAWEGAAFAPEAEVLAELKAIPGVTQVETQTFTFMSM